MNLISTYAKLTLYLAESRPCPYLAGLEASNLLIDPYQPITTEIYDLLLQQGFRRSGEYVYKPGCKQCQACVSVRVPVARFRPSRGQKRVLNRNKNTRLIRLPAEYHEAHFQMYKRYLTQRHQDSDMCDNNKYSYMDFLGSSWCHTEFIELRDEQQQLFAVTVADITENALSAVYTFFDPDYSKFSPGQLAILKLIELARQENRPWLYLGYWIADCQKMNYKTQYQPIEKLIGADWIRG